jgi:hypothetical protein
MKLRVKYLIALCSALVLASCAQPEPVIVSQTQIEKQNIPIVPRPRPVSLVAPTFYVVSRDNFEEFIKQFERTYATQTFIAISVRGYENLALSIADIHRFLDQQNEIIVYYETQVTK